MTGHCDMCDPDSGEYRCMKTSKGRTLWSWVGEFNLVMFTEVSDGGECDEYALLPIGFCPFCGRRLR